VKVLPYGEGGAYVDLEAGDAPDRAARTHALAAALREVFPGADVVAGAGVVAVFAGAAGGGAAGDVGGVAADGAGDVVAAVRASLGARMGGAWSVRESAPGVSAPDRDVYTSSAAVRTHWIDVVYDGPDLDDVAARLALSRARVIELHTGREHTVELVGFLPGFAYMGPVDPRLVVPRRSAPRPRVEARSVAIAGAFTGVYPLASPGGWNLLGRGLGPLPFDPSRPEPFLFAPGDRVCFRAVEAAAAGAGGASAAGAGAGVAAGGSVAAPRAPSIAVADRPALVLARSAGIATVQDAGRPGLLGRGVPPSGPLDPALFSAANRAAGNPFGAAAIELLAGAIHLRARGAVVLSIDGAPAQRLADGEDLRVGEGERAVRYIAVAGGIDVPVVVGARSTLLSAKIGGMDGRVLRAGDELCVGAAPCDPARAPAGPEPHLDLPHDVPVQIDPGPHLDRFPPGAFDLLLAAAWRVSALRDRTGCRLEGASVPRGGPDLAAPVPMRRGAIQVTTDGTPIVLGPDHPTTGGYPVLAVVRPASLGDLAQRRPGEPVRFRL
jgi:KipI family sensor histidine kinase inhibitor